MSRVRNVILIALVACVLLSTGVLAALDAAGAIERPHRSHLEGKDYCRGAEFTPQAIAEGRFQDQTESFLADSVACRDNVMLTNAAFQRGIIRFANLPFGYPQYHTFLGSEYYCWPEEGVVTWNPYSKSPQLEADYASAAAQYSQLAQSYPETSWYFYLADRGECTQALPYGELMADPADYPYIQRIFLDKLSGIDVIEGAAYGPNDTEMYLQDYFRTDHHWNITGAYKAYARIINALGKVPRDFGSSHKVYPNTFWGSQARSGLCPEGPGDQVYDVYMDLSRLEVTVNGEKRDPTWLNKGALDPSVTYPISDRFDQVRANWLHYDYGVMDVINPDVEEGSLLIIRDSFGSDLERFFTADYHRVVIVDLRRLEGSFKDIMDQVHFDDAVFLQAFYTPADPGTFRHLSEWD